MAGQYLEFLVSQERFEEAAALMPRLLKVALLSLPPHSYVTAALQCMAASACGPYAATAILTHSILLAPLIVTHVPSGVSSQFFLR